MLFPGCGTFDIARPSRPEPKIKEMRADELKPLLMLGTPNQPFVHVPLEHVVMAEPSLTEAEKQRAALEQQRATLRAARQAIFAPGPDRMSQWSPSMDSAEGKAAIRDSGKYLDQILALTAEIEALQPLPEIR